MATIEERATAFADKGLSNNIEGAIRYTYIYAANEQRKIDIEKACKLTCSQCPLRCKDVLTSGFVACGKHTDRTECKSLQLLIKAMEE